MTDFTARRTMMVDTQIRPSDVDQISDHRGDAFRAARRVRAGRQN